MALPCGKAVARLRGRVEQGVEHSSKAVWDGPRDKDRAGAFERDRERGQSPNATMCGRRLTNAIIDLAMRRKAKKGQSLADVLSGYKHG